MTVTVKIIFQDSHVIYTELADVDDSNTRSSFMNIFYMHKTDLELWLDE